MDLNTKIPPHRAKPCLEKGSLLTPGHYPRRSASARQAYPAALFFDNSPPFLVAICGEYGA
jgi:hypothetical protein